jgi:hypothetical protein
MIDTGGERLRDDALVEFGRIIPAVTISGQLEGSPEKEGVVLYVLLS